MSKLLTIIILRLICSMGFFFAITTLDAQSSNPDSLFRYGQFEKAKITAENTLQLNPTDINSNKLLARIALLENKFHLVEKFAGKVLEMNNSDTSASLLIAESFYRQDKFAEAVPYLIKAGRTGKADLLRSFGDKKPYSFTGSKIQISFEQTDPLPVIKANINDGEDLYFLLDTGGPEIILDEEWAKSNNLPVFSTESGTFAGGKNAPVGLSKIDKMSFNGNVIENIPVRLLNTQRYAAIGGGKKISGVIGTVLLYHFIASIDYPSGKLILEKKTPEAIKKIASAKRVHTVPFWLAGSHFMVAWGLINNSDSSLLFIDTGLAAVGIGFAAPESTIKSSNAQVLGNAIQGTGGGGTVSVIPILLKSLAMGNIKKENFTGLQGAFPAALEYAQGFRIGGLVSHSFFRDYKISFDYENMKMYIQ